MDRHLSMACCNQFIPMHQWSGQVLSMDTKSIVGNSSLMNQHLSVTSPRSYIPMSKSHQSLFPLPTMNRPLSYDQPRYEEDHSLRIHVGNIPFLWTVDDLCKQFLVFGPIKDPEIVTNERGSKGFGFITFLRHSDGINAIRVKNGSIADGRKITVALASSRSSSRINSSCYCHRCSMNNNNIAI